MLYLVQTDVHEKPQASRWHTTEEKSALVALLTVRRWQKVNNVMWEKKVNGTLRYVSITELPTAAPAEELIKAFCFK